MYLSMVTVYQNTDRLGRVSDYRVTLSVPEYGDCISEYGQIRESVRLSRCRITEVPLYPRSRCPMYTHTTGL